MDNNMKNKGALYLGAVGAYDWSGTIVKYDSASDQDPDIPDFAEVQSVLDGRTKESYLGYSITSGFFNGRGNGDNEFVAIGAPRYSLKGAVVIYKPEPESAAFTNAHTIYPNDQNSQLGSYFGGSLLALDLNGDGRDDLLVGAPLYSRRGSYDNGRVFVYIAPLGGDSHDLWANNLPTSLFKTLSPGAMSEGGRFGTAMASAGDLNDDGYNDVIIGAPYLDGNKGGVFIFHGSTDGIDTEYKQVIRASELPNTYLRYFGLSLQGAQDLDGNGYPDIAVGAPKSDTVVIFRSRPVVKFQATLSFDLDSVNVFDCLTTPNRDCLVLTACLNVSGSSTEPLINVDYGIDLDSAVSGVANKRVEFRDDTTGIGKAVINGTRNVTNSVRDCWNTTVFVKQTIPDNAATIEAVLTYKLSESHQRMSLSSVRDPTVSNQVSDTSEISRDCGDDNVCKYDLGIDAVLRLPSASLNGMDLTNNGQTLIISQESAFSPIIVKVNLTNTGESAYGVNVVVNYTAQLSWNNLGHYQSSNKPAGFACVDDAQNDDNGDTWRVKVLNYRLDQNRINILPEQTWCYFEFNLSSNSLSGNGALPEISVAVSAGLGNDVNTRDDENSTNNQIVNTAPVRYRADATAQERSPDIPLPFNFTDETVTITSVNQIGMNISNFQMTYEINGRGHSNIPESRIRFSFPYRLPNTTDAEMMHLLYLYSYSCESTEGEAECICDESVVNPYNLLERFPTENDTDLRNITISSNTNKITQSVLYDCSENGNEAPGTCATLQCSVIGLASTDNIIFRVNFRFWSHSFNLVNSSQATLRTGFKFSTEDSPLLINQRGENVTIATASTDVVARLFVPPEVIISSNDIWIYIVAAIGGLLLLIIIIIVLWKTGFFKSKYAEKKEQLEWTEANASGGSNGDAASTADIVGS